MSDEVVIIEYKPKYRERFRELNYEWLERYFTVEPYDRIVLSDPEREVIKRGGAILFALIGKEVVGTCALLKHTDRKYELAKMGVTEKHQGRCIGRKLVEASIKKARELGAKELVLATSPKLEAANHLYRGMGFAEAAPEEIGPLPYQRHSIVMAMDLSDER